MNSFIYSGAVSLVVTFLATITTYALALYRYKGSDQVFLLFYNKSNTTSIFVAPFCNFTKLVITQYLTSSYYILNSSCIPLVYMDVKGAF